MFPRDVARTAGCFVCFKRGRGSAVTRIYDSDHAIRVPSTAKRERARVRACDSVFVLCVRHRAESLHCKACLRDRATTLTLTLSRFAGEGTQMWRLYRSSL